MQHNVPKPWTGSSSTAKWAPLHYNSRGTTPRPPSSSAREVRPYDSPPVSSSAVGNADLKQAVHDLNSVLEDLPPPPSYMLQQQEGRAAVKMEKRAILTTDDDDNNNSEKHAQMVDDLTKQLVHAFDHDEVVEGHPENNPFGNCKFCGMTIDGEASVVGKEHFHPKCFACADCKKPLGTEKYYIIGGKNYCSQDRYKFLEKCAKCGLVIENETIRPKESGKPYHADCFSCSKCGNALLGKYFNTDQGMLCEDDFAASRDKCARCGRAIMESTLKALDQVYHPNCFVCSMCPRSLEGIEFFVTEDNKPMCKEDFARFMAKTCNGCEKKITDETLVSTSNGKFFHRDCYNNRI